MMGFREISLPGKIYSTPQTSRSREPKSGGIELRRAREVCQQIQTELGEIRLKEELPAEKVFFQRLKDRFEGSDLTIGRGAENELVRFFKQNPIFPLVEQAPQSLDYPRQSSQVDLIIVLPSGYPLAVQLMVTRQHMDKKGASILREKYRQSVKHQIKPLYRKSASGREKVFEGLPMPIVVVALDEGLFTNQKRKPDLLIDFLIGLKQGLNPKARRQYDQRHSRQGASVSYKLEDYYKEVSRLLQKQFQKANR